MDNVFLNVADTLNVVIDNMIAVIGMNNLFFIKCLDVIFN
ncbi:hypothetical protein K151_1758 [Proteus hauseri ZMd44]|nr:hypothetical protein K151_1758 [Proteus hauseri ZMd44]